ncbi:MAG: universal stress protein [Acidimicrobiia bacterium]|nr:universal stress protein [Acidimicrobiia bacterium]
MVLPKMILVPLDLSKRSEEAAEYAAALAREVGASLTLMVNVNQPERAAMEQFARDEHITIDQAGEAALGRVASRLGGDVETSVMVRAADSPVEGIIEASEYSKADLIVMTSHGRTGMTRWLLGSVAERMVQASDVPVLVIPARG